MAEFGLDVEKTKTIREYLYRPDTIKQLQNVLPKFMNADRFLRTFYTAMLRNPALHECSVQSMLSAMIDSAQLGLEPVMGKAALVPYNKQVQFQPMYRGLIELARRAGPVAITVHNVYENDTFSIRLGDDEKIHHERAFSSRGKIIGTYTIWKFADGSVTRTFMSVEDMHKIRDRSKAYQRAKRNPGDSNAQLTPWITDEGEMFKKTVIKRHAKLQPASIELDYAVEHDDHVEFDSPPPVRLMPAALEEPPQKFEFEIPPGVDLAKLEAYMKECTESFGFQGVQDFKDELCKSGEFVQFWGAFADWLAKQPKKGRPKKEPAPPPPPPVPPKTEGPEAFNQALAQAGSSKPEPDNGGFVWCPADAQWVPKQKCEVCSEKETCDAELAWKSEAVNYRSAIGAPAFQRVLMVAGFKDIDSVPTTKRQDILNLMKQEVDKKNERA